MPYLMTEVNDEVDVKFEVEGGDFTITIGTIPAPIGEKIDACYAKTISQFRSAITGDDMEMATLEAKQFTKEASILLCKYGIRGHDGLQNAGDKPIPCVVIEEEGTGFKCLDEATLNLYVGNENFLTFVCDKLTILKRIGVASYIKHGEEVIKQAIEKAQEVAAPFMSKLEKSYEASTNSPKESEQA